MTVRFLASVFARMSKTRCSSCPSSVHPRPCNTVVPLLIEMVDRVLMVRGSEDSPGALWVSFNQIDPQRMFEDHYHIIRSLIGTSFREELGA